LSSGTDLYWGSGSTIWRFAPGDPGPSVAYEASDEGLIWDLAALPGSFVFSEQLTDPEGGWRVVHVDGDAAPEEIDRGFAAGGAPPTLAIDARRVAWAGFDESSGTPMTFLRVAERAAPAGTRTLVEADIETQLLWYPQLDGDTLWFARIEPDFDGTRGGDRFGLHTIDLLEPSSPREAFDGLDRIFDPAVSPDFVVWKSVEEGLSALTWGALHVLDRRSNERFDIPGRYNHPTLGTRFLGFEEFFRNELLLYDLRTGSLVDVPDALPRGPGTIGHVAIGGSLLGYTITARGGTHVGWAYLPE
jgi:hypothetical protein